MDEYKIRYLDKQGKLVETCLIDAADQEQAKLKAASVADQKGYQKYEVWADFTMIQII